MLKIISVFLLLLLVYSEGLFSAVYSSKGSKYLSATRLLSSALRAQIDWYNESFSKDEIQDMWKLSGAPRKAFGEKGQGRALLTIGAKGLGPNTLNSLSELLKQHETVRVKVASDAIDTMALSKEIMDSSEFNDKATLLAVKTREFMIGRK